MLNKVISLLQEANKSGVKVALHNGELQVQFSKGKTIDPTLLQNLKASKQDIINFLSNDQLKAHKVDTTIPSILPVDRSTLPFVPLSFSQERVLFIHQLEGSGQYHLHAVFKITGAINAKALEQAFLQVIQKHKVLRSCVGQYNENYCQVIKDGQDWKLHVIEGTDWNTDEDLLINTRELVSKPFDLFADYMLRANLVRLQNSENLLVVIVHHIAADGWSLPIIVQDVAASYNAIVSGVKPPVEKQQLQFADYAFWQRNYLKGAVLDHKLAYWSDKLSNVEPLQLLTDFQRPAIQNNTGAAKTFTISNGLVKAAQQFSVANNTTLFVTLLSVFKILLHRYTNQTDICVGTPIAGRQHEEVERLVGFFANTLALRSTINPQATFIEVLNTVRQTTMEAYEHQEVPFEKIVDKVARNRDLSRSPIFQVMFGILNLPTLPAEGLQNATITRQVLPATTSTYELNVIARESADGLQLTIEYFTSLFAEETIERLGNHFILLLQQTIAQPAISVDALQFITGSEKQQLVVGFNDTDIELPSVQTIIGLFEQQVKTSPDAIACLVEDSQLTYAALNAKANQLAHYLQSKGIAEGAIVPICIERGMDMLVGLLGILKTGACFVPVDPEFPADRIQFMIQDAAATLIVTSSQSLHKLPAEAIAELVLLDKHHDKIASLPNVNLPVVVNPGSLAYIIHTSGSTGRPKGVMIEHKSVVNLILSVGEHVGFTPCSTFLSVTTYSFDICYLEVFMPLITGGKLVVVPRQVAADGYLLRESLAKFRPSHMQATPSTWHLLLTCDWDNPEQLKILIGGEAVREDLKERLTKTGEVWNVYGPTETTIWSAIEKLETGEKVTIGKPVANTQIFVIDSGGHLAPVGVPGEICIGGMGLARGYLNLPELTAEKFIKNTFAGSKSARIYRTGDVGRWLNNGHLEYVDRMDNQVKVRGFRIELGEIENALMQTGLVKQVVVVARPDAFGNKRLVGYISSDKGFDEVQIVEAIRKSLPEYMVPSVWMLLDKIPLTPNGKIDRKALPEADLTTISSARFVAPSTPNEKAIAAIWQSLIGVNVVGIHDNFFQLGGHSLLAMQVISAMRKQLDLQVSLKDFFLQPTIAALAKHSQQKVETPEIISKVDDRPLYIPLSFSQERLWFIDRLEGSIQYHIPAVLRIKGNLSIEALRKAFETIIQRHEVLRTVYPEQEGQAYQLVIEAHDFAMPVIEVEASVDHSEIQSIISSFISTPFDLSTDAMLRAQIIHLSNNEYLLIIVMHHIASDGWSIQVVVNEITSLYEQFNTGVEANLPNLPFQYADYAIWQQSYLTGERLAGKLDYWKGKLEGVEPLQLPTDLPRPVVQSTNGSVERTTLPGALAQQIQNFDKAKGVTAFMSMLTVFNVLLHKYCNQNDVCVGTPVANRNQPDLENLVGFFINSLALRTEVLANESFDELLQKVRTTVIEAFDYQDVPFEKVVEAVVKKRDLSRSPLFQVLFLLRNEREVPKQDTSGLQSSFEPIEHSSAMFDLTLNITETQGNFHIAIEYRTDLFLRATIQRMLAHFVQLLTDIMKDSSKKVGALQMLTLEEEKHLMIDFNDTETPYPVHKTIEQFFEEQVQIIPGQTAVVFGNESLTYQTLNERSNQLAHYLQSKGVKANSLVPVFLERSTAMVVAVFAILKAGGGYVPVDPEYPAERIRFMLAEVDAPFILSSTASKDLLAGLTDAAIINLDVTDETKQQPVHNPAKTHDPSNIGYVLYTSGSTGRPKGAFMPVGALVNLLHWQQQQFGEGKRHLLQFSSLNFDVSYLEIFGTLGYGGTLFLIDGERRKDPAEMVHDLLRFSITHFYCPVVVLKTLAEHMGDQGAKLIGLKEFMVAGEQLKMTAEIVSFLNQCKAVLTNQYGPTEGHVVSSYRATTYDNLPLLPPIGKPINNTQLYILNQYLQPVPIGVTGDLYIGGVPSKSGYIHQPVLNKEKFISDPFSKEAGAKLYKTGDVARWLPDGNIDFLGRKDDQVKIRGFRIELGEIESVLQQSDEVNQVAVIAKEDPNGSKRLICYVVPTHTFDRDKLINYIKQRVPDFMIPSLWVPMEKLPVNKSGKIDKRSLPDTDLTVLAENYVAPRNATEETIAAIWKRLLKVERVGIYDNFFEIGGHSLLATRTVAAIRNQLHSELTIRNLFQYPTIAELVTYISQLQGRALTSPVKVERPEHIPLSYSQERLWVLHQIEGSVQYHLSTVLEISGHLNVDALTFAFKSTVDRHEALRTTFPSDNGTPRQFIRSAEDWKIDVEEILPNEETADIINNITNRPFDLSLDYMLRIHLFKLDEERHIMVIVLHHIAADGWSVPILVHEVAAYYNAFVAETKVALPELTYQYADYSIWQRNYLQGKVLEEKLSFWKQNLQDVTPMQLPEDFSRPATQSFQGATISTVIDKELLNRLTQLSQKEGATIFMTLLAAFNVLIYKHSGQQDISIGTPVANRSHREFESLIGFFINIVVLRNTVNAEESFREFLRKIKDNTLLAYENQDAPFEKVIEVSEQKRDISRSPLFQAMFVLQNFEDAPAIEFKGLQLNWLPLSNTTSKYDISFFLKETASGLALTIEYCTALFKAESIRLLMQHYLAVLYSVVSYPDQQIVDIDVVDEREKESLLFFGKGPVHALGKQSIVSLFEEVILKSPLKTAVIYGEQQINFQQLNARANALARGLLKEGITSGMYVPICIHEGIEMIIGLLGILKTGAAYVPIDPDFPRQRIAYILNDTQASLVISNPAASSSIIGAYTMLKDKKQIKLINVEFTGEKVETPEGERNINAAIGLHTVAYVIYTSGSTGYPKGVMVEHAALLNYLFNSGTTYNGGNSNNSGSYFHLSYTFDASLTALFMPLLAGKSIVIESRQNSQPFQDPNLVKYAPYDFIKVTPAHLPLLFDAYAAAENVLLTNKIVVGGEALLSAQLGYLATLNNTIEIINEYGPTEATVGCTTFSFFPSQSNKNYKSVSIGKPIDNTTVYILNDQLQLVPTGVAGEICIGGAGLARGYLNNEQLTKEKFIANPFEKTEERREEIGDRRQEIEDRKEETEERRQETGDRSEEKVEVEETQPQARIYKTGDVGRWLADGNIEYLGRKDEQVKISGYRIELGEIENVLLQSGLITQAVVTAQADGNGIKRLVAYVVSEQEMDKAKLTAHLSTLLPAYMVPGWWMQLEKLPLTPNGKVDKKALPQPDATTIQKQYTAPTTDLEQALVNIWQELLGIERVGIEDNFFELGGDSITSIQAVSRINRLGYTIQPKEIFIHQNIERLSKALIERTNAVSLAEQGTLTGSAALLPIQQWYLQNDSNAISHFNQSALLSVDKLVNESILQNVVDAIMSHHDALRFTYENHHGEWQQSYAKSGAIVQVDDLSDAMDIKSSIKILADQHQQSLDITKGTLIRVVLIKLGEDQAANRLLIVIHHLAIDGVSWRVLLEDMEALLSLAAENLPFKLPYKTSSYRQWYHALQEYGQTRGLQLQLKYWQQVQSNYEGLVTDHHYNGVVHVKDVGYHQVSLDTANTRLLLQELPRVYHTEINDILLSALFHTFKKYCKANKLLVGLEGHGREDISADIDTSRTVGWFTNLYPVQFTISDNNNVDTLIKTVKEELRSIPDKGLGFGVLKYINKAEALHGNDPWEIVFNYLGQLDNVVSTSRWFSASTEGSGEPISKEQVLKEKISVISFVGEGSLIVKWMYSKKHFTQQTIKNIATEYIEAIHSIIKQCQLKVSEGNTVFTPSDFGLGAEVTIEELDDFLKEEDDSIFSF